MAAAMEPTALVSRKPAMSLAKLLHLLSLAVNALLLVKVFWRSRRPSGDRAQQDFRRSMQAATAMCTSHGKNSVVWNIGARKTASIRVRLCPRAMLEVCACECSVCCVCVCGARSLH